MTLTDLFVLLPLIILAASALIVLLLIAFYRCRTLTFVLTLAGFALAFISLPLVSPSLPHQITSLFIFDEYAFFYIGLLLAAGFVVTLLTFAYLQKRPGNFEELYVLLLIATLGATVLVTASHFVSFFLGLETLTVSLYVLIAYVRTSARSLEAGIKYLILAAVSSAFLLFGMALVYADLGTMDLARMAALLATRATLQNAILLTGLALMIIGIGFKLAVVPFHMWTPDIYEGAPAPITAFIATVSKGGMFALLLRYFGHLDSQAYPSLFLLFALIAAASMFGGNLLALLQTNVKRLLAYSSIAHLGYLLVALLAGGSLAITAVTYYLVAYFVTTLAAFGTVAVLSDSQHEAEAVFDYRGLFWRRPWLAGIFTASLLSLAGIPLTAGFIGKFYLVTAGVSSALQSAGDDRSVSGTLVIILVVNSAIGLYYYLRLIVVMGLQPRRRGERRVAAPALPLAGSLALAGLVLLLVWLGVYPAPLLDMIQATVAGLV